VKIILRTVVLYLCISLLRQVPDNQEVFIHDTSDQSLTVELLSYVAEPDDQALRLHQFIAQLFAISFKFIIQANSIISFWNAISNQ